MNKQINDGYCSVIPVNVLFFFLFSSSPLGMSVYNVVILSILGVAITSVIRDHQDATFAITAVFIIFCTTLTLCFVFVPKVCLKQHLTTPQLRPYSYAVDRKYNCE